MYQHHVGVLVVWNTGKHKIEGQSYWDDLFDTHMEM